MSTFTITSKSGKTYTFTKFDPFTQWNEVGGVYMFLQPSPNGDYALYIGQTENFRKRMPPNHERWDEAKRRGATTIAATVIPNERERLGLEIELILRFNPPMNEQHKGLGGLLG